MKKLLLASLMVLPLSHALALDCQHAMTQSDMTQCASEDYKKADNALNSAYQKLLKAISGKQKTLLQSAQKKWIAFRDADCSFQTSSSEGGSVYPMVVAYCMKDKTEQRTNELNAMAQCPEGDLTCSR